MSTTLTAPARYCGAHVARFSDYDDFGFGYWVRNTWGGCLDAPDYIPHGSVRIHRTIAHAPSASSGHRDWETGCMPLGTCHDGPETAAQGGQS